MAESQKENQCAAAAASSSSSVGGWEKRRGGGGGDSSSMISDLTMPSYQQQPRSRSSLAGESPSSPSPSKRKPPPELLTLAKKRQQHHYHHETASSQSSGEKTREDVNIYHSKKPAAMNNHHVTNTPPTHLRGDDAKDDEELEKAKLASQKQYREEQRRMNDEKAQLERVMKESLAVAKLSPQFNRRQDQQKKKQQSLVGDDDVILIDSDDEDLNQKMSAKRPLADADKDNKMPANYGTSNNNDDEEEDDIQKAIRLSLEEQNKPTHNNDDVETNDDGNDDFHCRVLSRKEFEDVIYPLVDLQGGFPKIEKGKMVQMGNTHGDIKNSKSQSKAQYGRYMIESFWRVFDVLEGKIDTKDDEAVNDESNSPEGKSSDDSDAAALKQDKGQQEKQQIGSKITALTDIGHGIGLQVMQAGWTLDAFSRGIELMEGRHEIAQVICQGVIEELRSDPPDSTKVDLRLENLVHCVLPPPGKSERDEELRRFVLFQDKPEAIQKGLVIFANNAEDVFAARSNDSGSGACLDEHLAELFGNMKVGGRCVTLTDIRCHLTSKDDARWYHYESFDSGVGAVSWSPNKSVAVHVLTKISDEWICSNEKLICPPSNVVTEKGTLRTKCLYCEEAPRRQQQRNRRKRKIYSPEDGD
ncbi:hypothetical protein QTG54_011036 [Skeletonema marinoi]|uniref:Uncharacterized protein n=1 Tax=Skeletonema marinoi TaxID=267567 RepID=A0AAD8Y3H6_9STRA|nr:hypothetical protein QTG54_011036 [Skeletonema marinoi]